MQSHPERRKPGIELDARVVDEYNDAMARRQIGSGCFLSMKGDVRTPEGLEECKKRYTLTAKGERTITIHLAWLEKIMKEALEVCGMGTLVFQFAKDDRLFCIKSYQDELADRRLIRELMNENARLRSKE